jgi:hypothetical protein
MYDDVGATVALNNCTVKDNTPHYGTVYFQTGNYSNFTIEDCTFEDIYDVRIYAASALKFKNCTFNSLFDYPLIYGGSASQTSAIYTTSKSPTYFSNPQNQPFVYFDGCTFGNSSDLYAGGSGFTYSVVLFNGCTFQNDTYGYYALEEALALWYGTNTFTSITVDRRWGDRATHLHVRKLVITVKDNNGNNIENACVSVVQAEGKEEWSFLTDSNGQVINAWGDQEVFFVEKEETSTGVYDQWSNSISGGQFHWITVSKEGFQTWKAKVEFDADRTITATLVPTEGPKMLTIPEYT